MKNKNRKIDMKKILKGGALLMFLLAMGITNAFGQIKTGTVIGTRNAPREDIDLLVRVDPNRPYDHIIQMLNIWRTGSAGGAHPALTAGRRRRDVGSGLRCLGLRTGE